VNRYETIDGQTILTARINENDADLYTKEGQFISINPFDDHIIAGVSTITLEEALRSSTIQFEIGEWFELKRAD
jgi:hypothetical protein